MPTFLRRASWDEVAALFFQGDEDAIRNADGWAVRYGEQARNYRACEVVLEAWTHSEIADLMSAMSEVEPRMTADLVGGVNNAQLPPRVDGLPAVLVQFGSRFGMIDGKHRANRWKKVPGRYAMLVVRC